MNRITRLLNKSYFKRRQRQALKYSHKYVITADDIKDDDGAHRRQAAPQTQQEKIDAILDGFEPEDDVLDRLILFEITGFQLREGEFAGEGTSDEDWERVLAPDPQANAYNYR